MDGLAEGDLSLPKLSEGPQIPFYRAPSTSPAPTPLRTFSEEQSPIPQLSILLKLFFRNFLVLFRNYSSERFFRNYFALFRNYFALFRNYFTIFRNLFAFLRNYFAFFINSFAIFRNYFAFFRNFFAIFRNYFTIFRNSFASSETISRSSETLSRSSESILRSAGTSSCALQQVFFTISTFYPTCMKEHWGLGWAGGLLTYLVTATLYTCLFCDAQNLFSELQKVFFRISTLCPTCVNAQAMSGCCCNHHRCPLCRFLPVRPKPR